MTSSHQAAPEEAGEPLSRLQPRPAGVLGLGLAALALMALIASLSLDNPANKPIEITGASSVQSLFGGIHQSAATLGTPAAPVTIDFFNDLQCSSCRDYQLTVVPRLVNDLVRPGKARLIYRHFPLGERARELADYGAVAAAQQDDQWQFVELFFINQGKVPAKGVDEDFLSRIGAAVLEFDLNRWRSDFGKSSILTTLDADNKLALDLRLRANPAAVVSGAAGMRVLQDRPSADAIEAAFYGVK